MLKVIKYFLLLILLMLVVWVLLPAPIEPAAWTPQRAPAFNGSFAYNDKLLAADKIQLLSGYGPEDVAVDKSGRLYAGLQDGRIVRINGNDDQELFTTIANGRPLGLAFDKAGNLIVADAWQGLLLIDTSGMVTLLVNEHGGRRFQFTNDLDIANDGKIYFSDASDKFNQPDYRLDMLEARPHGRLLVYDPVNKTTDMLLDNLYFANGVAISSQQDYVLVNETGRYRIHRYWLAGDKQGQSDIFIDNLPGFPDGISANRSGLFWLALASPRNPLLDWAHPRPWMKSLMAKLPRFLQPSAIKQGIVIAVNENGKIVQCLQDKHGEHISLVTSVEQAGDMLYLGTLEAPYVASYALSAMK